MLDADSNNAASFFSFLVSFFFNGALKNAGKSNLKDTPMKSPYNQSIERLPVAPARWNSSLTPISSRAKPNHRHR